MDCVVEVGHRHEYEKVAKRLRKLGFHEDVASKVLCRAWQKNKKIISENRPTVDRLK
jgi:hypothetical protein